MKNLLKMFFLISTLSILLNAEIVEQYGSKNGYDVELTSKKSLVVGDNELFIKILKDNKFLSNTKVKLKVFMPEMPGMPYMEYEGKGKLINNKFKVLINFSMSGTWQYHLKFKTKDNKVHKVRGNLNL